MQLVIQTDRLGPLCFQLIHQQLPISIFKKISIQIAQNVFMHIFTDLSNHFHHK